MSIQKEDVYETEDYPSTEIVNVEENFDNPDIEKIYVDIEGAMKRYGNRVINADHVDFSDSLNKKRRGYGSGSYVLEIVGSENRDDETIEQKFDRLRFELDELAFLNEKTEADKNAVISKAELDLLNNILQAAIIKNEGSLTSPFLNEKNESLELKQSHTTVDSAEWRNMDERIKRIEQAVIGKVKNKTHHEPLIETIDNLRLQVESLNPGYLEGVKNQLTNAISKLAEFDDKRKKLSIDDCEEKINELYKLVTKWDVTCENIPAIVKRLHSLSKLHEQAQEFSSRLNEASSIKQHLDKKIENHKVMLFELKKKTTQVIDELSIKIIKIEEKIGTL